MPKLDSSPISDDELEKRVRDSINMKHSRNTLYMDLRSERVRISEFRLNKMWAHCGGSLRNRGRY